MTAPTAAPQVHQPWQSQQRDKVGAPIAMLGVLGLVAAAFALIAGVHNPVGLVVAIPLTAISMGVVLSVYFWLDRWEPEPSRLLLFGFLWGATIAVVVSIIFELATSHVLGTGATLKFFGPLIEEATKGAFLLVMLTGVRRKEFDGVIDGLVYAGVTAAGFAYIENIGYIADSFGQGTDTGVATIVMRLIIGPFAHPLFTSLTGIGVGMAVAHPRSPLRFVYPAVGFVGAVALHAAWNSSLEFGLGGYVVVYVFVMLPALIGAGVLAGVQRRRERDVVRRQLPVMVYYRWITPNEAGWLADIGSRRMWVRSVKAGQGKAGARALKAFQVAATELAFLRDRVDRNVAPADAYYLHAELVHALMANRAAALPTLISDPPSVIPVPPLAPEYVRHP
jgi:RsiW-degrading membrane proteinase PrsW (M82 family)